jgi:hypothetical protein
VFPIYGEAGVGKSSFARVLLAGKRVETVLGARGADFISIFLTILARLGEAFTDAERADLSKAGYTIGPDKIATFTFEGSGSRTQRPIETQRLEVNFVVARLIKHGELSGIIVDEFQRIQNDLVQSQVLEVIKGLSDGGSKMTIVIAGTADDHRDLLGGSAEYEDKLGRYIFPIELQRMEQDEVEQIFSQRRKWVDYSPEVCEKINWVSSGYPARVHQLALTSSFHWLTQNLANSLQNVVRRIGWLRKTLNLTDKPELKDLNVRISLVDLDFAVRALLLSYRTEQRSVQAIIDAVDPGSLAYAVLRFLASMDQPMITEHDLMQRLGTNQYDLLSISALQEEVVKKIDTDGQCSYSLAAPHIRVYLRSLMYQEQRGRPGTP